ncbi:tetratricopeptide repeat protein [Gammaproteobacteria bacterium AS21]
MIKSYYTAILLLLASCTSSFAGAIDIEKSNSHPSPQLTAESLVDLLSAEFASNQQNFRYALHLYLKQAQLTKDAAIAKRATRLAQHIKDVDGAKKATSLWIKAAPNTTEPYQLLTNILVSQNLPEQALAYFKTAIQLNADTVLRTLSAQANHFDSREAAIYINLLDTASDPLTQQNSQYFLTLGLLHTRIGDFSSALKNYNLSLAIDTQSALASYQKVITLKELKQYQQALTELDSLRDRVQKKLIVHNNQYDASHIQLLFLLERNENALSEIATLLEQNPNDYPLHLFLALSAFDYKEQETSKDILQNLLISSPEQSAPHFYLGLLAEQDKQPEQAIDHYLQVKTDNLVSQAQHRVIELHTKASDRARVEQLINEFSDNNKNQLNYAMLLAKWLNTYQFKTAAIDILEQQLDQHPQNIELLYAHAMYIENIDFAAAEQSFKKILQLSPKNPVILNAYGYTLTIHTERYPEALALITQALALSPDDPATIDSMGWVQYKLHQYDEAVKYLTQAYQLYRDPEVGYHLIAALLGIKNTERAKQIFTEISVDAADNKYVKQAHELLENNQ